MVTERMDTSFEKKASPLKRVGFIASLVWVLAASSYQLAFDRPTYVEEVRAEQQQQMRRECRLLESGRIDCMAEVSKLQYPDYARDAARKLAVTFAPPLFYYVVYCLLLTLQQRLNARARIPAGGPATPGHDPAVPA